MIYLLERFIFLILTSVCVLMQKIKFTSFMCSGLYLQIFLYYWQKATLFSKLQFSSTIFFILHQMNAQISGCFCAKRRLNWTLSRSTHFFTPIKFATSFQRSDASVEDNVGEANFTQGSRAVLVFDFWYFPRTFQVNNKILHDQNKNISWIVWPSVKCIQQFFYQLHERRFFGSCFTFQDFLRICCFPGFF